MWLDTTLEGAESSLPEAPSSSASPLGARCPFVVTSDNDYPPALSTLGLPEKRTLCDVSRESLRPSPDQGEGASPASVHHRIPCPGPSLFAARPSQGAARSSGSDSDSIGYQLGFGLASEKTPPDGTREIAGEKLVATNGRDIHTQVGKPHHLKTQTDPVENSGSKINAARGSRVSGAALRSDRAKTHAKLRFQRRSAIGEGRDQAERFDVSNDFGVAWTLGSAVAMTRASSSFLVGWYFGHAKGAFREEDLSTTQKGRKRTHGFRKSACVTRAGVVCPSSGRRRKGRKGSRFTVARSKVSKEVTSSSTIGRSRRPCRAGNGLRKRAQFTAGPGRGKGSSPSA